ncbi:MAG: hypothetical protein IPN13_12140 [Bacteroidetes bacterium]|nr:hypothetical protein [Bacteroidota bacterium]
MKKLNSIIQKHILLFVGVVMLTHSLNAQSVSSCGTVFSADPNFHYQAYQQFVQQSSFFPMVGLPIRIHIIRQSNGSGGVSYNDVQNQLSNANNQYSNSNLSFFECSSVDYIDDSNLYTYELTTDETL